MRTPQPSGVSVELRKLVVLVDGPSFFCTAKGALGIGMINCQGLYDVLVKKIGKGLATAFPPLFTMSPDKALSSEGIAKELAGAGFEIIPASPEHNADDIALKNRISNLDPREIAVVVMVTADRDFVPSLRSLACNGVVVIWVSTRRPEPRDNRSRLPVDVDELCKQGVFQFVDLAQFIGAIKKVPRGSSLTS